MIIKTECRNVIDIITVPHTKYAFIILQVLLLVYESYTTALDVDWFVKLSHKPAFPVEEGTK